MKIGSVSVVLINFVLVAASFPQNIQDLEIGDACRLKDGSKGSCKIDKDCPYFIELVKRKKWNEIVNCGFKGINQVVCCKESPNLSSKFQEALCEGSSAKKPNKPVRFTDHVLNGEQAYVAEFPHFAALGYNKEGNEFRCGGALISDTFVLTAAHCCNRKNEQPVVVRLGKTSLYNDEDKEEGQDINVARVIVHAEYSSKSRLNDIALLQLETPARLTHNVWPACVSSKSQEVLRNLTIIGFGRTNTDTQSQSDWLLKGFVNEVPLAQCQKDYNAIPNSNPVKKTQICANNQLTSTDTCLGDSGGPLEYLKNNKPYIYGLTSYGLGCGSSLPSIYTRVDQYLDWLSEKMSS